MKNAYCMTSLDITVPEVNGNTSDENNEVVKKISNRLCNFAVKEREWRVTKPGGKQRKRKYKRKKIKENRMRKNPEWGNNEIKKQQL